jgi:hypothetical protein
MISMKITVHFVEFSTAFSLPRHGNSSISCIQIHRRHHYTTTKEKYFILNRLTEAHLWSCIDLIPFLFHSLENDIKRKVVIEWMRKKKRSFSCVHNVFTLPSGRKNLYIAQICRGYINTCTMGKGTRSH